MHTVVVQARMGSTRLQGKVLKPVAGRPLLSYMIERLGYAKEVGGVVIATTDRPRDDVIEAAARAAGAEVFRGDEKDVLDRYYKAARHFNLDVIVRATSDCPLIDPAVTDQVIREFRTGSYDYVSNMHPPTFPDGLDTEVIGFPALERAWREATAPHEREHVTPFIWDQPNLFRIGNVANGEELHLRDRWTVDHAEDLAFVTRVLEELYRPGQVFHMEDIHKLLSEQPGIAAINAMHAGTNWWSKHWQDLRTKATLRTRLGDGA